MLTLDTYFSYVLLFWRLHIAQWALETFQQCNARTSVQLQRSDSTSFSQVGAEAENHRRRWSQWVTAELFQLRRCRWMTLIQIKQRQQQRTSTVGSVKTTLSLNEVVPHFGMTSYWPRLQHWAVWFPGIKAARRNRWWPVSLAQCKWWLPTTAAQACRRQNKTLEGILRCRKLAAASVQFGPQSLCVVTAVCRQTVKNCRSEETKNLFPFLLSLCTEISLSFGSQDCISKLVVDKKYSSYETIF